MIPLTTTRSTNQHNNNNLLTQPQTNLLTWTNTPKPNPYLDYINTKKELSISYLNNYQNKIIIFLIFKYYKTLSIIIDYKIHFINKSPHRMESKREKDNNLYPGVGKYRKLSKTQATTIITMKYQINNNLSPNQIFK